MGDVMADEPITLPPVASVGEIIRTLRDTPHQVRLAGMPYIRAAWFAPKICHTAAAAVASVAATACRLLRWSEACMVGAHPTPVKVRSAAARNCTRTC